MTRRQAIKTTALVTLAAAAVPHVIAQTTHWEYRGIREGTDPFELPQLPYPFDALEPQIDACTLEIHLDGHHAAYVTNLNKAFGQDIDFYIGWASEARKATSKDTTDRWLEGMLRDLNSVPEEIRAGIRNNGGGHYNHTLFWQMMRKNGGGKPKGDLAGAISQSFGSFERFKAALTEAALGQFGNGWAWLTIDHGALRVEATANEDTPLSMGRPVLLGIDVWEHAYYLNYQNKRADYVAAWFNVINWDFVAERYAKLKS